MIYDIEIGDEAKDTVTGISGIVVVKHNYLYGIPRIGIQPTGSFEGKPHESIHIDILQGELIKKAAVDRKGTAPKTLLELGAKGKCRITGFEGICTGRAEWLYSCTKVLLQSEKLDFWTRKPREGVWLDEPGIKVLKEVSEEIKETVKERTTGGFGQPIYKDNRHN